MKLAKTIEELPDGDAQIWGLDIDNCPVEYIGTFDDLKRLVATLRKCETAIESLDGLFNVPRMDELLSEIREVLGGKGN